MRDGRLPEVLASKPEIQPGLEIFYKAFSRLNRSRNMNGVIEYQTISAFCKDAGFDDDETELCFYVIQKMDEAYGEVMDAKSAKASKDKPVKGK